VFGTFDTLSDRLDDLDLHVVAAGGGTQVLQLVAGEHTLAEVNAEMPPSAMAEFFGEVPLRLLLGVLWTPDLYSLFSPLSWFPDFDEEPGFYVPAEGSDEWVLERAITSSVPEPVYAWFVSNELLAPFIEDLTFSEQQITLGVFVVPGEGGPPVAVAQATKNNLYAPNSGTFYVDYVWHNRVVALPVSTGTDGLETVSFDPNDPPFSTSVGDTVLVTTSGSGESGIYRAVSSGETVVWQFDTRLTYMLTSVSQHDVKAYGSQYRGALGALQEESPTWWRTGYGFPNWREIVDGPDVPYWFRSSQSLFPSWTNNDVGGRYNLIDTTDDDVTVTLPSPVVALAGRVVTFLHTAGGGTATVTPVVEGSVTLAVGESVTLLCDGEFWRFI
jgi:hypothetical protein